MAAHANGLTSKDAVSSPSLYIILSFLTVAFYNVIELNIFIFTKFKKRNGLYFWSMILATWGIALNGTGYMLKYAKPLDAPTLRMGYTVLVLVGWCAMVTGQSVVLFSRLHLLVDDRHTIKLVLAMIIVDAIVCHPPIFALFALINSSNPEPYAAAYSVYEKFQLILFCVQESIISVIYIQHSAKFLKNRGGFCASSNGTTRLTAYTDRSRLVMRWLIAVNVLVVLLDVSILVLEFSGQYGLQTSWKCLVYSVKLKLEFSILNKLIMVVKARNPELFQSDGIKLQALGRPGTSTNILTCSGSGGTSSIMNPKIEEADGDLDGLKSVKSLRDAQCRLASKDTLSRSKSHNSTTRLPMAVLVQMEEYDEATEPHQVQPKCHSGQPNWPL